MSGDGRHGDDGHALALDLVAAREAQLRAMAEAGRLSARLDAVEASAPALARACTLVARQCEAARRSPIPGLAEWFVRTEGMDLADRENLRCDALRLLAYAEGVEHGVVSRNERTAHDAARAVGMALAIAPGHALSVNLVEAWNASEATNTVSKVVRDAAQLDVERASEDILVRISGLARDPSPAGAAEIFRSILRDGRFRVRGRMAAILGPLVVRIGFEAPNALVGTARHLPKGEDLMAAAEDADTFQRIFYRAVADGADRTARAMAEMANVREGLLAKLGQERSGAKAGMAVDAFLRRPLMSVTVLRKHLETTQRGSHLILDKLVARAVVRPLDTSRVKGRLYVCDRAILA